MNIKDLGLSKMILWGFVLTLLAAGCGPQKDSQSGLAAMPVPASHPLMKKITNWDEYTGRFQAVERVEVRSRVSGYVESVNFKDGQMVKKGDVLYVIDKRPFAIALKGAQAKHAQMKAEFDQAQSDFNRSKPLRESRAVSEEEFEQRQQKMVAAAARVEEAAALVDEAALNLEFAEVKAPIDGRVSRDYVNPGNLISGGTADATLLTTVVSFDPIHFYFEASETELLKYIRMNQDGTREDSRTKANPIFVQLLDEKDFLHEGAMDFVDNEVALGTGTIQGRAVFKNTDHTIEPGMFGRARLLASGEYEALLVPDAAIGSDQTRKFVYVINETRQVELRPVELGPLHQTAYRVIRKGLTPQDLVVIGNIQKVRNGLEVVPEMKDLSIPETSERVYRDD
ncbi:MAG: efflux RND transporter periplasmic adaptor subunit [Candidatus Omnitrophica bacterium]|nr:efflux RND transporter periplasmic adaptor subunit [Candidatus Omnitrophota bacterium]